MTVLPSAGRGCAWLKTAGASSSAIRVIGGARIRPETRASASRARSSVEAWNARLIPVAPAAASASTSATYCVVTAVPPRADERGEPGKGFRLADQVHERIDAIRMRLSYRVRPRDRGVIDGLGSAVTAHALRCGLAPFAITRPPGVRSELRGEGPDTAARTDVNTVLPLSGSSNSTSASAEPPDVPPPTPANPRKPKLERPCSRAESPPISAQPRKCQDRPVTPEVAGSSP
jgi:hypothetical protein